MDDEAGAFAWFETTAPWQPYTRELQAFLHDQASPVTFSPRAGVLTSDRTVVSTLAFLEMGRRMARWVARRRDGVRFDVTNGHWEDGPHRRLDLRRQPQPGDQAAVLFFRADWTHRLREDLLIGGPIEALNAVLERAGAVGRVTSMGETEDVPEPFERSELTRWARGQVMAPPMKRLFGTGSGLEWRGDLGPAGVGEHVLGQVVLGPWSDWSLRAPDIASQLLDAFAAVAPLRQADVQLVDGDPTGGIPIRRREESRIVATAVGPAILDPLGSTSATLRTTLGTLPSFAIRDTPHGEGLYAVCNLSTPDEELRVLDGLQTVVRNLSARL